MRVTINQVETHFQRIGHGEPVVLLHGWGCDWQIWSPVITKLSESHQLFIPDLPAFGSSAAPTEVWDSEEYVKWLTLFVEKTVGDRPFSLVGHSFGGKIAALWAAKHPTNLLKLILVDASGLPDPLPPARRLQKNILGLIPGAVKDLIPKTFRKRLLDATGSATDYFNANPQQRSIFQAIINEQIGAKIAHIQTPTLVIWGVNDLDTPLNQGKAFAALIPQSQLSIFTQSGHFPFVDEATHFIEKVSHFIDNQGQ